MTRQTDWGQPKTTRHFRLTDIGHNGLEQLAKPLGISRNELLERLGRTAIDEQKMQALLGVLTIALAQPHNTKKEHLKKKDNADAHNNTTTNQRNARLLDKLAGNKQT